MGPQGRIGDRLTAAFAGFDIQKPRGGYTLVERRGGRPLARLKPFPQADRFELFYQRRSTMTCGFPSSLRQAQSLP